jgi:hypothetical protein
MKRRIVWKRVLLLVAGALGLCVIGIVALVALGQPLLGAVRAAMWSVDPARAQVAAHQMLDYELPDGYAETKVRTVGSVESGIMITSAQQPASLIVFQHMEEGIRETESWRRRYEERWYNELDQRRYQVQTVEIRPMQIAGTSTPVRFLEGTDKNGQQVKLAVCIVPGKAGDVLVGMLTSAEAWNLEEVEAFYRSIQ